MFNVLITFAIPMVLVCFIHYLPLNVKKFIEKNKTFYIMNGISFIIVIGIILSAFVPTIFLSFLKINVYSLN